jgi:hypothetical protein
MSDSQPQADAVEVKDAPVEVNGAPEEVSDAPEEASDAPEEGGDAPVEGGSDGVASSENENESHEGPRKKIVIVGLGMVGISFMYVFPPAPPINVDQWYPGGSG